MRISTDGRLLGDRNIAFTQADDSAFVRTATCTECCAQVALIESHIKAHEKYHNTLIDWADGVLDAFENLSRKIATQGVDVGLLKNDVGMMNTIVSKVKEEYPY